VTQPTQFASTPNGHTVEKIGGTSMSQAQVVLDNIIIGDRTGDDFYGRIFVVSAYGGVTNELLDDKKTGEPGVYALFAGSESSWAWGDELTKVSEAMLAINAEMFGDLAERSTADLFVRDRVEGVRGVLMDLQRLCSFGHFDLDEHMLKVREMLSSLGEAHSAHNLTLLLRHHGVNASFVDLTGWRDERQPTLEERIQSGFASIDLTRELPVCTGYAQCRGGLMGEFGRGYTEVVFSHIAVQTGAREAIIHKEFHLSSADPNVVGLERVRTIGQTNYDVADQLSNMGMEAVHPHAAKGLRQAGIPLRVRNTFEPDDEGTTIRGDYVSETPRAEIVTGLRSVFALEVFEQDMVRVKGYDTAILDVLRKRKLRIVTKCSNANTITHYVSGTLKQVRKTIGDIEERYPGAHVGMQKVALVSVIGSDLGAPNLLGRSIGALEEGGVPVLGLHRLPGRVDVMFIVPEERYEDAVRALHADLVEAETLEASVADG